MPILATLPALLLWGCIITNTYGLDIIRFDKGHNVVKITNCSEPEMYLIFDVAIIVCHVPFHVSYIILRQLQ